MASDQTPKRLPANERRQKIIDAARSVFVAQAYSGARTKQIAELAGVTEAFLYRHFDSKESMYEAAILGPIRDGITQLRTDLHGLAEESDDPVEFIERFHRRCLMFYGEFASLLTVALYSELDRGRDFYRSTVKPDFDAIGRLLAERGGWADRGIDPLVVRQATLGADWAIGLDRALRRSRLDVDAVSGKLTLMFTVGVREKAKARSKSQS